MVSAHLAWKYGHVITLNNGDTRSVLEGLSGYAEPGTFTSLMGPSGSGKSTLLDALSGHPASNAIFSGKSLLNGCKSKLSFGTACLSIRRYPDIVLLVQRWTECVASIHQRSSEVFE